MDLYKGKVCWGYEMDLSRKPYSSFSAHFAVVLLNNPPKSAQKAMCMCLAPTDDGLYVPDDSHNGAYLETEIFIELLHYRADEAVPVETSDQLWCAAEAAATKPTAAKQPAAATTKATAKKPAATTMKAVAKKPAPAKPTTAKPASVKPAANITRTPPAWSEPAPKRISRTSGRESLLSEANTQRAAAVAGQPKIPIPKLWTEVVAGQASPTSGVMHKDRLRAREAAKQIATATTGAEARCEARCEAEDAAAQQLFHLRAQFNRWRKNSCYVDASLVLWDCMQRWAVVTALARSHTADWPADELAVLRMETNVKRAAKVVNLGKMLVRVHVEVQASMETGVRANYALAQSLGVAMPTTLDASYDDVLVPPLLLTLPPDWTRNAMRDEAPKFGLVVDICDDNTSGELEPSGYIKVTAMLKAPLLAWWNLRQQLYYLDTPRSEAWLQAQVDALDLQRYNIRRAVHQRTVTGRNEQQVQARLAASLESHGGAISTLLAFIGSSREPFLRVSETHRCPECGAMVRAANLSNPHIFISQERLSAGRGNPLVALQQQILEVGEVGRRQDCPVCHAQVCFIQSTVTSIDPAAGAAGIPSLVLLELHERDASRKTHVPYDVAPGVQELCTVDGPLGSFKLVGMLRYHVNHHYIADVRDPHNGWMRCDGMSPGGVGCPITPACGCIEHTDGLMYHPIMAIYALTC